MDIKRQKWSMNDQITSYSSGLLCSYFYLTFQVNHMRKKFLTHWMSYRKQQVLARQHKNESDNFFKRNLLKKFYTIWKHKVDSIL